MFTVLAVADSHQNQSPRSPSAKRKRTDTTARACLECKRRKVKCTGTQPCESCVWYKCEKSCVYSYPSADASESLGRKDESSASSESSKGANTTAFDSTTTTYKKYKHIVQQLFPNYDIGDLCMLNRAELLLKLQESDKSLKYTGEKPKNDDKNNKRTPRTPHSGSSRQDGPETLSKETLAKNSLVDGPLIEGPDSISNMSSTTNDLLDVLEDGTQADYGWKELEPNIDQTSIDDVNGLSMGIASHTSYLGPASVSASLKVLEKISKVPLDLQEIPSHATRKAGLVTVSSSGAANDEKNADLFREISAEKAQRYVDAYFEHVHSLIPLVHKPTFLRIFETCKSPSKAWTGLFYMVLALGTVAVSTAASSEDVKYFSLARKHLDLDSLGSGDFFNLDALALMSYYLHYRHQPNTAIAIMGAALRIAASLSLHRELPPHGPFDEPEREQRRKRWWTLYCMDIWGLTTLGRPSFGVNVHDLTLRMPTNMDEETGLAVEGQFTPTSALISNIELCKIISKIESLLVQYAVPSHESVLELDTELQEWYHRLPSYVKDGDSCPKKYYTTCCIVKWRYQNSRLVLFKTYLLNCALAKAKLETFDANTQQFVRTCRRVAMDTIDDIASQWEHHQMSCWKAVWFVFQSCMVLVISLYSEDRFDKPQQSAWAECIERGLDLMSDMSRWSLAAPRSIAVIKSLYERSQELPASGWSPQDNLGNDALWNDIIWGWTNNKLEDLLSLEELVSG